MEVSPPDRRTTIDAHIDRRAMFAGLADSRLDDSYRLARLILGDPYEAEDATHDAFVAAWRGWDGLRDHGRFDAWFERILINTCRNRLRRTYRHRVMDIGELLEMPDRARDPRDALVDRAEMEGAFAALSAEHRTVLALRFYADLPVVEIASRLDIRSGTVKSRLHHAIRALGAALQSGRREGPR